MNDCEPLILSTGIVLEAEYMSNATHSSATNIDCKQYGFQLDFILRRTPLDLP
jgi:hypothetical protein